MAKSKKQKKNSGKWKIKERREKGPGFFSLPFDLKRWIVGAAMFLVAIVIVLSFFGSAGIAGAEIFNSLTIFTGKTFFLFPVIFLILGITIIKTQSKVIWYPLLLSTLVLILGISGVLGTFGKDYKWGGVLGNIIASPLLKLFGTIASSIIFFAAIVVGFLIIIYLLKKLEPERQKEKDEEELSKTQEEKKPGIVSSLVKKIFVEPSFKIKSIEPVPIMTQSKDVAKNDSRQGLMDTVAEKAKLTGYEPPPLDLLDEDKGKASGGDIQINSAIIKKTLENFGIPVQMADVNIGPTVAQYTLKPAEGIKLSKITTLSNDLALALATHPIRMEAPIPGKSLVGIELPNKIRTQVRLKNLLSLPEFQGHPSSLAVVLGRDVAGNPMFADLGKMPHLMVAGATGTGKTICLNSLILNLLYRNGPETLKIILIDPKRVEFPVYQEIPHLLSPVICDAGKTVIVFKWLTMEMEQRFQVLSEARTRDIGVYNEAQIKKGNKLMPYIVVVVDELADLMMARGKDIEAGIVRLAQMARAVGIHLIIATQRPSVEVITGLIKANITARVSFQVSSQIDSRTILDTSGAEKLLGMGDMLYLSTDAPRPKRIQGAFVSDKEVKRVMDYFKEKQMQPDFEDESAEALKMEMEKGLAEGGTISMMGAGITGELSSDGEDPLYEQAKDLVIRSKKASASLLQRYLRIGYARAARLIDILEERGVVGPGEGAKPREVYSKPEEESGGWEKV